MPDTETVPLPWTPRKDDADLFAAVEIIALAARDMGPDRARDLIDEYRAIRNIEDTDEWRLISEGIIDTLRRASDRREGCNRWITIHDTRDGSSVQFAWDSTDTPMSRDYAGTIWTAILQAMGRVQPEDEAPE